MSFIIDSPKLPRSLLTASFDSSDDSPDERSKSKSSLPETSRASRQLSPPYDHLADPVKEVSSLVQEGVNVARKVLEMQAKSSSSGYIVVPFLNASDIRAALKFGATVIHKTGNGYSLTPWASVMELTEKFESLSRILVAVQMKTGAMRGQLKAALAGRLRVQDQMKQMEERDAVSREESSRAMERLRAKELNMQKEMKEIVKNLKAQLEAQQERAMLQSQEELAVYHHNELVERDGVISRLKDELKSAERNLESCKRHRDSLQDELNNEREKSAREFHQRCLLESRLQSASLDAENSNKNFGMIKSQLLQEIEQLKMGRRQEAAEFEEQLTEIAEKMTASAKQWNSERGMLKDEISSVKKENQILIKAKMEVEEALKAAAEKEAQLQNTILEIEDRLNLFALQRQQDLRDAERKTEELSELVAKTRDRNHEMSEELKDFQNIARAQKAEISSLRMSLQDESVRNQSEKKNLLGQVNALKDQILKSKNLLEESMHDTKQLANEKVEMSAEIEFEKKRRRDAESQSNSLKKAIEETKSQIDQLRLANQKQKEENLELKKHEESYRKSIKSLKAELERQCVLTDKLREEMLVQQNKDADNQNQLNILRKKLESLSKQKTEMKSEREQEQEQMQLHMSRMEEKEKSLSSRIVELEQQESNLMRMVEGLRNDTAAAEDEVKAVRAEMSEKQQTFSEVEKALQARLLKSHKLVEEVETSPAQERILKFEAEAKCRRLQEELDDLTTLLHVKHIKNRNGEVVDLEDGDVRRAAQNRSGSGEHEASMSGGWMMSSPPAGTKSVTFSSQLEPSSVKSLREEFSSFLSSEGIEPSRSKKSSVTSVSSFMANAHKEIRR